MSDTDVGGRREWARAASDLVHAVNGDEPVTEVISRIAAHALGLLELDMCAVMMPDDSQSRLLVVGSAGLSDTYIRRLHAEHPLTVDHSGSSLPSPSVDAFVSGRTVAVSDIESAPAMTAWRELALAEGYGSLIATPLSEGGIISGVLVGYTRDKREFADDQVELLAMFAVHAGATILAAHRRDELEAAVAELHSANEVLRRQSRSFQVLDRQHRRLMQVMANDVGMSGVVTMLAELLGCSVTVEDPAGKVLATATHGTFLAPPRREDRADPETALALEKVLSARSGSVAVGQSGSIPFWVAPATLNNEVVALLWVGGAGLDLDDIGRRGIERFALAVALEISKQRSALQVRLRLSRDVVADLLSGVPDHDRTSLLERAAALGHPLDAPQRIIVARADRREDPGARRGNIVDAADAASRAAGGKVLVGAASRHAVLLLPDEGGAPPPAELARRMIGEFRRRNEGRTASAIVGAVVRDIAEVAGAYRAARGALDLMSRSRSDAVADLSDVGVAALLLSHGDTAALEKFAGSALSGLSAVEPRRAAELIETLTVWLEENRSINQAARRLNVHANTVSQRLNALEQALGRPLRDPGFLLDVQVALAIRRIADPDMLM